MRPPAEKNRAKPGKTAAPERSGGLHNANCDIASMLLRFQGAPILTLIRLFRLCFSLKTDTRLEESSRHDVQLCTVVSQPSSHTLTLVLLAEG